MNFKEIKKIVQLLKEENLTVLSISDENTYIHVEQKGAEVVSQYANYGDTTPTSDREKVSELLDITAEQIGTFYIQKDENSDETFVSKGDKISIGDKLGFIEAMKVFSDVKSEINGIVAEIVVANGDAVEFGDVLLRVHPEEV